MGTGGEVSHGQVHAQLGNLSPSLTKLARDLRRHPTTAEAKLWQCLRARRLNGLKFRREHPLGANYISDFYCPEVKVSVELDGEVHDTPRAVWADGIRHRQIQEAGVRVVRLRNEQVLEKLETVLEEILQVCEGRRCDPQAYSVETGCAGGAWREAQALCPGSLLIADETGRLGVLASLERVLAEEPVYDLTIEEDHSFITEAGAAHNCGSGTTD